MVSRRLIPLLSSALLLGVLSGCEKPVPAVSALASGDFHQASASLWCFEGQAYLKAGDCREDKQQPTKVSVRPGAPVAIEVPQDVKERGWFVRVVDGQNEVAAGPIQKDKSYFTLSADFQQGNTMNIQVVALPQGAGKGETSGFWEFTLANADAS